jgi:oxygen-independent coproporphyrinogen-3 oxidase
MLAAPASAQLQTPSALPIDLLRRDVIMALMCRGRVGFDAVGEAHAVNFRRRFAPEFAALAPLVAQGKV